MLRLQETRNSYLAGVRHTVRGYVYGKQKTRIWPALWSLAPSACLERRDRRGTCWTKVRCPSVGGRKRAVAPTQPPQERSYILVAVLPTSAMARPRPAVDHGEAHRVSTQCKPSVSTRVLTAPFSARPQSTPSSFSAGSWPAPDKKSPQSSSTTMARTRGQG
ncbi:hypothetical protein VTK73DRAFT_2451 [Phialemonium thermophilum]|uniref:Uncharacterized protein n=1 Tax=Phialemonium thermophilum TaxID=223376 RepID=A0ABR3VS42_9PEZI